MKTQPELLYECIKTICPDFFDTQIESIYLTKEENYIRIEKAEQGGLPFVLIDKSGSTAHLGLICSIDGKAALHISDTAQQENHHNMSFLVRQMLEKDIKQGYCLRAKQVWHEGNKLLLNYDKSGNLTDINGNDNVVKRYIEDKGIVLPKKKKEQIR